MSFEGQSAINLNTTYPIGSAVSNAGQVVGTNGISVGGGSSGAGGTFPTGTYIGDNIWWQNPVTYYPLVYQYYPQSVVYWENPNKTEKAFKIIEKLIEKKLIKVKTVKEFIELVNEISAVL